MSAEIRVTGVLSADTRWWFGPGAGHLFRVQSTFRREKKQFEFINLLTCPGLTFLILFWYSN